MTKRISADLSPTRTEPKSAVVGATARQSPAQGPTSAAPASGVGSVPTPVPASVAITLPPGAPVAFSTPVRPPAVVGLKMTFTTQVAPGASTLQSVDATMNAAGSDLIVVVTGTWARLATTNGMGREDAPSATSPKSKMVGVMTRHPPAQPSDGPATPLPARVARALPAPPAVTLSAPCWRP